MYSYTQISNARKLLGGIPTGTHKKHDGVNPSHGSISGGHGFYSTCIRGNKARIDCDARFLTPEQMTDGHLTKWDLNNVPDYCPSWVKNRVSDIVGIRDCSETLSLIVVRHYNSGKVVYCGSFLYSQEQNAILFSDYSKLRFIGLLNEYRLRIAPTINQ